MLDTLAEVQERHEAVKELEKSLMELHQVFLDMAVLVEAQGEMLDNIEQQVGHRSGMRSPARSTTSDKTAASLLQSQHNRGCWTALVQQVGDLDMLGTVNSAAWRVICGSGPAAAKE